MFHVAQGKAKDRAGHECDDRKDVDHDTSHNNVHAQNDEENQAENDDRGKVKPQRNAPFSLTGSI